MTPDEFREATLAISRPDTLSHREAVALHALGLAGEAGEVVDEIKKLLYHGKPLDRTHLLTEIGDVLWYVDRLLRGYGWTMSDAMEANVAKLRARYPDGWDAADRHYDYDDQEPAR